MSSFVIAKRDFDSYFPNNVTLFRSGEVSQTLNFDITRGCLKVRIYYLGYEITKGGPVPTSFYLSPNDNKTLYEGFTDLVENIGQRVGHNKYAINCSDSNRSMTMTDLSNAWKIDLGQGRNQGICLCSEDLRRGKPILSDENLVPHQILNAFGCQIVNSTKECDTEVMEYSEARRRFDEELRRARLKVRR